MSESSVLGFASDPMGAAIMDYHRNGCADVLRVFSSDFEEDEIPNDMAAVLKALEEY